MKVKLKAYLVQLPRWFALPFFSCSFLMGVAIVGDVTFNVWIAFVMVALLMASGHAWNSVFDYVIGLDKGEPGERSVEKSYTGGQSLIERGTCSVKEVVAVASAYNILGLGIAVFLSIKIGWLIFLLAFLGSLIAPVYTWSKFNYTHELALGTAVGPLPLFIGMLSVGGSNWLEGLLASVPIAIILSFAGLALDEHPDAEANLKKGVKSIAYKVWEYKVDLSTYLASWIAFMYIYQVFLISVGIFTPLTGITFLLVPVLMALLVMLKGSFEKTAPWFVMVAALYPMLLVVGQALGGG